MTRWQIYAAKVEAWAASYDGPPFHAMLCDPPYHLISDTRGGSQRVAGTGPYGRHTLGTKGFMGKEWDGGGVAFDPATWAALRQHLLPGAFCFAFASSRGWHRLACAIEDAGFVFHPSVFMLGWNFASGFPKATDVSKQIDKARRRDYVQAAIDLGLNVPDNSLHDWTVAEHAPGDAWWNRFKATLPKEDWLKIERVVVARDDKGAAIFGNAIGEYSITVPVTDDAKPWAGHRYGLQALKPALEPILCFQNPYVGKPVDSITRTGAGALNIDGARIGAEVESWPTSRSYGKGHMALSARAVGDAVTQHTGDAPSGRWPANFALVHLPECERVGTQRVKPLEGHRPNPVAQQAGGEIQFTRKPEGYQKGSYTDVDGLETIDAWSCVPQCPVAALNAQAGDCGGGTFTVATRARNKGWANHSQGNGVEAIDNYGDSGPVSRFFYQADWADEIAERIEGVLPVFYEPKASQQDRDGSKHPTHKPTALAKYLATLLLPPKAYAPRRLLVPFSGAGSEMIGAMLAGWDDVTGIEQDEASATFARGRIVRRLGLLQRERIVGDAPLFASVAPAIGGAG